MGELDSTSSTRGMHRTTSKSRARIDDDALSGNNVADRGRPRVLVIEDNAKLSVSLERGLGEHGFSVHLAATGAEGERAIAEHRFDVIVLDLMLPDRDGVELCRTLRQSRDNTPILMLSALSSTRDKIAGLDSGADDYLAKPFEFDELLSRVRAMLRRRESSEATVIRHGDIELDIAKRVVTRAGSAIPLTNKEFSLLEYLMRRPGVVLTRTQIGEAVWQMNFDPNSNVIDVYVSMLRRKVDKGFSNPVIHTIVGTGYAFGEKPPTPPTTAGPSL